MKIQELAEDVYALVTPLGEKSGDSNFGLVVGDNGAALIDADIRRLEETQKLIRAVTDKPVRFLINTHDNFDHSSANTVFFREGAVLISSLACREAMEAGRKDFQEKMASEAALKEKFANDDLTLPEMIVRNDLDLYLGQKKLELKSVGHGHSRGDVIAYLPGERILFSGDIIFNECHPVIRNSNTANWISILEQLEGWPVRLTVPGHGAVSEGNMALLEMRRYFQVFRDRTAEMIVQKVSLEEAQKLLAFPEYEDWAKKNWLPSSIEKIYGELSSKI